MRNSFHKVPAFYKKKNDGKKRFFIGFLLILAVLITWGFFVPKIRQRIVRPLYGAFSYALNSGRDILRFTLIQEDAGPSYATLKVYPTLQLPERNVLFAENIAELDQTDPLAELRSTPVPENEINAAQWVYLEDYDAEMSGERDGSADIAVELPAPVFERADLFNEGSTALSAYLRFWGKQENQYKITKSIRPSAADTSVSLSEMLLYTQEHFEDLSGMVRMNGSAELIQKLLTSGFPLLIPIEKKNSYSAYPGDDRFLKDYILITGFDTNTRSYTVQDPLEKAPEKVSSEDLLRRWYSFRRDYLLIYPQEQEESILEILGENRSEQRNLSAALAKFETDSESLPEDPFCKLNYAYALLRSGKTEDAYAVLSAVMEKKIPQRYLSYESTLLEALFSLGKADELLELTNSLLVHDPENEDLLTWRGWAFLLKEEKDLAKKDFAKAFRINPNDPDVTYANKYFESIADR